MSTTLDFMDTLPPNGTASLQRDIAEGRPSEIEAWNGDVINLGGEKGVTIACTQLFMTACCSLRKKQEGNRILPQNNIAAHNDLILFGF